MLHPFRFTDRDLHAYELKARLEQWDRYEIRTAHGLAALEPEPLGEVDPLVLEHLVQMLEAEADRERIKESEESL